MNNRTIQVTGEDSITVTPDHVRVRMNLWVTDEDYEKTQVIGTEQLQRLQEEFNQLDFSQDALKTSSYSLSEYYEYLQNDEGESKRVFRGYQLNSRLFIEFPFENKRLHQVLNTIGKNLAKPELSLEFFKKDEEQAKEELLIRITENAKRKAQRLSAASGVNLGDLLTINYSWVQVRHAVQMDYSRSSNRIMAEARDFSFTPEDIEISDSATFIWAIE